MAELLYKVSGDLSHLHDVGQHAMDEIYISWEDAVKEAYERYGVLHEMALSGELGIRKQQSLEYFMKSAATILDGTEKAFRAPAVFYEGMRENFEEFREDLEEKRDEIKLDFIEKQVDFNDKLNEFKENLTENIEDIKGEINDHLENIKENLAETFDITKKSDKDE